MGPLAVPDIFLGDGAPASAIDRGAINRLAYSATGSASRFIPTLLYQWKSLLSMPLTGSLITYGVAALSASVPGKRALPQIMDKRNRRDLQKCKSRRVL